MSAYVLNLVVKLLFVLDKFYIIGSEKRTLIRVSSRKIVKGGKIACVSMQK